MVLGIYGSGGLGRETLDLALSANSCSSIWSKIVFIDDFNKQQAVNDAEVFTEAEFVSAFSVNEAEVIIAVGEITARTEMAERIEAAGYKFATIIHPSAHIGYGTKIGKGIAVHFGAFVSCNMVIGNHAVILQNVTLGHDGTVGENTVVAPCASLAGNVHIGANCYIGLGASIMEGKSVKDWSIIGVGSVIMKNVPENVVTLCEPARIIKSNNDKKVFRG